MYCPRPSEDNLIAWYENKDGKGTFGLQRAISRKAYGGQWVHATDIDGDGDLDVLSASTDDNGTHDDKVAWYENLDGKGRFGDEQIITTKAIGAMSVHAADVDN